MDFNNIVKSKNSRAVAFKILLAFLVLIPMALGVYMCYRIYADIENAVLNRRQSVIYLASTTIKERLDRIVDLGISFATRPRFVDYVSQGNWVEAMSLISQVPKSFSYIERVAFF